MPMKRRKYADGGLVVSRGGRDISGLRLFDDTPAAGIGTARAVAEMAASDEVSARPTIEELQAANLAAVRAREARETARPVRRQTVAAPAPRARATEEESAPRATPRATPRAAPKPAADSDFAAFRKRMIDNTPAMRRLPSEAEIKEAYANRGKAPAARPTRRTYKSPRTTTAELRARGMEAARRRAEDDETPWYRPLPPATRPLALKKGGHVKKPAAKPAAKAGKKAMPMAAMMMMAVPAKAAKKPAAKKMAAGGMAGVKKVKGYAMGGRACKGMKKK